MIADTPLIALSLAFGTGLVASLSPCVYPIIPITVGYLGAQAQYHRRWNVLLYVLAQILTLVLLSLVTVTTGETLGFSSESRWVQMGVGLILIIAGVLSWREKLPTFFGKIFNLRKSGGKSAGLSGPLGAALLGAASILVASPCTTPILAGILAVIAGSGSTGGSGGIPVWGLTLMTAYAIGFSLIFLVLGLGLIRIHHLPRSGSWLRVMNRMSAAVLLLAGVYYLGRVWI